MPDEYGYDPATDYGALQAVAQPTPQTTPTVTTALEPVGGAFNYPTADEAYAANLKAAMERAYSNASTKSFGARGELSSGLDRIDPTVDFEYSPTATQYASDVGQYLSQFPVSDLPSVAGFTPSMSSMNLAATDRATGAPMPYTSSQLEKFAASGPLSNQFYANYSPVPGAQNDWDLGAVRFAPDNQYRVVDRSTGEVVGTGTGYDAANSILSSASGLFDKSGNKANFAIERMQPGATDWQMVTEQVPETNGFLTWLSLVAPMAGGIALGPLIAPALGVSGTAGAALGTAAGSAAAGTAAGQSIGDILKGAALSGLSSYAMGSLLGKLGAGPSANAPVSDLAAKAAGSGLGALGEIVVNAPSALAGVGSTIGGVAGNLAANAQPKAPVSDPNLVPGVTPITVAGTPGANLAGAGGLFGGMGASALAGLTPQMALDIAAQEQAARQAEEQAALDEIVVTGARPSPSPILAPSAPDVYRPITDANPAVTALQNQYANDFPDPNEIVVAGKPGGDLGALSSLVAPTLISSPSQLANLQQQTVGQTNPDEIVVVGNANTAAPVTIPNLTTPITGSTPAETPAPEKSTLDKIADYLQLGSLGIGLGSTLLGGGGGSGALAKIPGGLGSGSGSGIYSAKLPTPGQGGAFTVGGLGGGAAGAGGATGSGRVGGTAPAGGWSQYGAGSGGTGAGGAGGTSYLDLIPQYGGVNPPGFDTNTWRWLGPQLANAPMLDTSRLPVRMAHGGYAVGGPGDGRSDEIPAMLSDGEYVIDAETVALLGNGSNKAGASQLDRFRANIRKHKGRELARGDFSAKAKKPETYLSGGRS